MPSCLTHPWWLVWDLPSFIFLLHGTLLSFKLFPCLNYCPFCNGPPLQFASPAPRLRASGPSINDPRDCCQFRYRFYTPPPRPTLVLCSFLLPHLHSDLCPDSQHLLITMTGLVHGGACKCFITSSTQPRQASPRSYNVWRNE